MKYDGFTDSPYNRTHLVTLDEQERITAYRRAAHRKVQRIARRTVGGNTEDAVAACREVLACLGLTDGEALRRTQPLGRRARQVTDDR